MDAWLTASPYRAVGVYISGGSRTCAQPNLTATWVADQTRKGWRLIPIELGYQAPCGTRTPKMSADPATARGQGRTAADSAVAAAAALGIGAGSTLYNDIEQYPTNASCRAAVLSFLSGWVERLHTRGYLAGMYSSGSSGIKDVCDAYDDTRYLRLDQIWIAWWNGVADTDGGTYCADDRYADQQRLHQYAGDVTETWGGVTMKIDRNYLDVRAGTATPAPWSVTVDNGTVGRVHRRRGVGHLGVLRAALRRRLPLRHADGGERRRLVPGDPAGDGQPTRSRCGTRPTAATTTAPRTWWSPRPATGRWRSTSAPAADAGSRSACSRSPPGPATRSG